MTPPAEIASFVLRVVVEAEASPAPSAAPARWHGFIRHVQSDAECHFTRWAEAVNFMETHSGLPAPSAPAEE